MDQEMLDELATKECECEGAKDFQQKLWLHEKALGKIKSLAADKPEIAEVLENALGKIENYQIDKCQIQSENRTYTLKMDSKGTVRVSRKITEEEQL